MKCRNQDKKAGFTLIEMLAVLCIIGIIFSITTPAMGPIMRTLRLTTSTENLANVLESARQYATTSGEDCYVVFSNTSGGSSNNAYKIYSYNGTTGRTVGRVEFLPAGFIIGNTSSILTSGSTMNVPFPEDSDSPQNVPYIKFGPDGAPSVAGNVYVADSNTNIFQKITYSATPRKVMVNEIGDDS